MSEATEDAREFTADLLAGRRNHIDDRATRGPGDDPRPTSQLLAETKQGLEELAQARAADPAGALADFRELLDKPDLTDDDLTGFLEVWKKAVTDPDGFKKDVEQDEVRGARDWLNKVRGYLHRPTKPNDDEQTIIEAMSKRYRLPRNPLAPRVNPHEKLFEFFDPSWVPLARAKARERSWPTGLLDVRRHVAPQTYSYPAVDAAGAKLAADKPHTIGLFADFGTGYYHSWGIAEQLAAWKFPYVFHLGDVYYAGRDREFAERFELPLFDVVEHSRFLGLAENHELYQGGGNFLAYFDKLRKRGRSPQEGSYFCVEFPNHQIIGLDVNWRGRRRLPAEESAMHDWLAARIADAGDRTVILLTGNAPFEHGHEETRKLLTDLWHHLRDGKVHMWFWGDDHYCALFDKNPPAIPFYGSCIGHGGYPGEIKPQNFAKTFGTDTLFLEDQARFPAHTGLRQDMTNNGWCQATLRPDGGVDLLYVDWLWCKRAAISFDRHGAELKHRGEATVFEREDHPQLHQPSGT